MELSSPLSAIDGLGPVQANRYKSLQIETINDLFHHYPRRYDDFSQITPASQIKPGPITIKAQVSNVRGRYTRWRGLHITHGLAADSSGSVRLIWYNQPYRSGQFKAGAWYYLSGEYKFQGNNLVLANPNTEIVSPNPVQTARIRPVYPATKSLGNHQIRRDFAKARPWLKDVVDPLPDSLLQLADLDRLPAVLEKLHFPQTTDDYKFARAQIGLRQLLILVLAGCLLENKIDQFLVEPLDLDDSLATKLIKNLPFELTADQANTFMALKEKLGRDNKSFNCLIQGDVGCGKTVIVGLLAALLAAAGHQTVLLAPTEILVSQHYQTLVDLFGDAGGRIVALTASTKAADQRQIKADTESGAVDILIGTQRLLSSDIAFSDLRLVVIDEQHRFGVEQRQRLLEMTPDFKRPHCLSLSATPIPRSLALVLYGELEIYQIKQKPAGRAAVVTEILPLNQRQDRLTALLTAATATNQAYVVCPAIDSNEVGDSTAEVASSLAKWIGLDRFRVLHGRIREADKARQLKDFRDGQFPVLVATSIIEAGLDIPNVNTIVIMSPERFGLAQLHQLRGRVGRRDHPGLCLLALATNDRPPERLEAIVAQTDGFALSELDLKLRGPGAIYGTKQWGDLNLDWAPLVDEKQIKRAQTITRDWLATAGGDRFNLDDYPGLGGLIKASWSIINLN